MSEETAVIEEAPIEPDHPAWSESLDAIDVSAPQLYRDDTVGEYFSRLRRDDPVHYCADSPYGPYWSITRYRDIMAVEMNHAVFSSDAALGGITLGSGGQPMRSMFITMDPPRHDDQRKAVNGIAEPANINKLKATIRGNVRDILDDLPINSPFDWVERVSVELTTRMLAVMFDFPFEDRYLLTRWSDITSGTPDDDGPVTSWEMRRTELNNCREYFTRLWQERMDQPPQPNLISMLAHSPATREMTPSEFLGNLILLIVGGNDTTRNSISGGLLALMEHPDQYDKLRANPDLVASLVPEIIRWQTPISHMARTATADHELNGKLIRKGDRVALWYLSGNRDPRMIGSPNQFIIDRPQARRHLSFGFGVHHCMGSRLAEAQLQILWEELLSRYPTIEPAGQPVRTYSNMIHGFTHLPVQIVQ